MYNRSSDLEHVDDARMASLFCHSNKSMENLPPNLLQHCKRVIIIKLVYGILINKLSNRPDPGEWGWEWNADSQCWLPLWTTLPIASKACLELMKFSCGNRCSCKRANWPCTGL